MGFKGRHILSTEDLDIGDYRTIMAKAREFKYRGKQYQGTFQDTVLIYLFFQPSTRTMNSSIEAVERYGGRCIGFADPAGTSVKKGENLEDNIINFLGYGMKSKGNIIVVRHSKDGAARWVADVVDAETRRDGERPYIRRKVAAVINGGDGMNQHPTQSLGDVFTVQDRMLDRLGYDVLDKEQWPDGFDGLDIMGFGDIRNGRALKSFIDSMAALGIAKSITLASHPALKLPENELEKLKQRVKDVYVVTDKKDFEDAVKRTHVKYASRNQEEWFEGRGGQELLQEVQGYVQLTPELLDGSVESGIVMHPQPFNSREGDRTRVITRAVQDTQYEAWRDQSADLVEVRAALFHLQRFGTVGEM